MKTCATRPGQPGFGTRRAVASSGPISQGSAAIGDETLFDLIDRPFDESLPSIRKLSEILGRPEARRSTQACGSIGVWMRLPARDCRCYLHTLPDGRPGLLIIAEEPWSATAPSNAPLLAQAFDEQPVAAVVDERRWASCQSRGARNCSRRINCLGSRTLLGGTDRVERARQAHRDLRRGARSCSNCRPTSANAKSRSPARRASKARQARKPCLPLRRRLRASRPGARTFGRAPIACAIRRKRAKNQPVSRLSRADETAFNALGQALKSVGEPPPVKPQPKLAPIELPQAVVRRLDALPEPTIIAQGGRIHYVNPSAIALLGAETADEILTSPDLAAGLRYGSARSPRRSSLPTSDGGRILLSASAVQIAWRGGPARQITVKRPEPVKTKEIPAAASRGRSGRSRQSRRSPPRSEPEPAPRRSTAATSAG